MQQIESDVQQLLTNITEATNRLLLDDKIAELQKLDTELADNTVWSDVERAQTLSKQAANLRMQIEPWDTLRSRTRDMAELIALHDDSLTTEITEQLDTLQAGYESLRKDLLYIGDYDDHATVLKLSSGVGGTDAQDWTEMLERMYLRWAERHAMKVELIERSAGEEAGVKNATYVFTGPYAYGKLKSEHGVHRLVRLSPFNSDNLRQTSFALVEVMPEIETPDEIELDEKDLKIDVYRSGGHGGQSVNTTDSAVRITHTPTNTVVAIQNERSQLQNKETALKILRGKLAQMQMEQHAATLADLRAGESASWGSQIRNYVLHPYTLVKDTRTKYEEKNADKVLNGDLDAFMTAYLEYVSKIS